MPIFVKFADSKGVRPRRHRLQKITSSRHCIELVDGIAFSVLPLSATTTFLISLTFPRSLVVR